MSGNKNRKYEGTGQALVEFALIILILAFLIFVIIEGARILQADLTAQNAARAAGRYAISGQFDPSCLSDSPPCADPRVESIKVVARQQLGGLTLADGAAFEDPNYYLIEVIGTDENGNQIPDYAGAPGMPVMVRVTYRVGIVTPLVQSIASTVRVTGQVVLNNERFAQISNSRNDAPQLTPFPTVGPSPTPIPPNLQLTKSDSEHPGPAIVDEPFFYVLSIVNISETDAEGATLVDTLPEGIDYISGPAGCEEDDGVVTCEDIDVPANSSTTINLRVVALLEVADTTVTNEATISHPQDQTPDNNSDEHETQFVSPPSDADLALAKSASATLIAVGNELVYTIGVVNTGLGEATGVTVVDTLPGNVTFGSATPSQGSCDPPDGNEVACHLGVLARNESATITIRVQPTQEGSITNTAEVSADQDDPNESNNNDSVTVEVRNVSDLSVTKMASANPVLGEEMTYTVNVVNNGPAAATGVQMLDSLPPSVTVENVSASQGSCGESGNVVNCNLGSLAAGANATVTIVVIPSESGSITNLASVSGDQNDPFDLNDDFELNTTIQPRADLEVSKTGDASVGAGDEITYELVVTNHGPSPAQGVFVTDSLPPGVTFRSASATQGTCGGNNTTVSCNLGQMAAGATAAVTIRVVANVPEEIENTVIVDSDTFDPEDENNTDNAVTEVTADNAYITLDQLCGAPGGEIEVSGYDWPTDKDNQYDIYLEWVPEGGSAGELLTITSSPDDNPFDDGSNPWVRTIQIPTDAPDGKHMIQARRWRSQGGGDTQAEDTAELEVPCPAPNLVVDELEIITPTEVIAGEPVTFRAVVSNEGNLDAISQFFTGLYFDPSPAPAADDTHIDQSFRQAIVALNGLAADASKVVTFTVDSGFETVGAHQVYAVADSDPGPEGVITGEHDETDNISTPLEVDVAAAPTPTPTSTSTPGSTTNPPTPTATPTATPTPAPTAEPGTLVVTIFNQSGEPQANAEINVYEEDSGNLAASGYSDADGNHFFNSLAPDTYTVTACITIENDDFFRSASGVIVSSGTVTQLVLFLQPSPAGCL